MKSVIIIILVIVAAGLLPYPSSHENADGPNPIIWEVLFWKVQDTLDGSSTPPESDIHEACLDKIKENTQIKGEEYEIFLRALAASESPCPIPPIQGSMTDEHGNPVIVLPNRRGPIHMDPCYWQQPECPLQWEEK